eukprot:661482-Hanusia_phi.AAC.2
MLEVIFVFESDELVGREFLQLQEPPQTSSNMSDHADGEGCLGKANDRRPPKKEVAKDVEDLQHLNQRFYDLTEKDKDIALHLEQTQHSEHSNKPQISHIGTVGVSR